MVNVFSAMNKTANQVNRSVEHSISKKNLFIVQSSEIPLSERFRRNCPFQTLKTFQTMSTEQGKDVNKIEERLHIRHQRIMTLNTRFALYRYKAYYNAFHDKLYDHNKATAKLQNIMRKRRTVLPPNLKSTAEHSASNVPSNVPRSLAETNVGRCQHASTDSRNTYSTESLNILDSMESLNISDSNSITGGKCKSAKVLTKEDLDNELDEYMAEIRSNMN